MRDSPDVGGWIELSGSQERKGRERRDYLIVRGIAGRKASVRSSVAVGQRKKGKTCHGTNKTNATSGTGDAG